MWILLAAWVAATPTAPTEVVKDGNAEVQKLLATNAATVEQLAQKADDFVDFAELAKRALGKEWKKLSKAQQVEFSATMKGLLRASYAQKAIKDSEGGKAETTYGEEKVQGNEATVPTTLQVKEDKHSVVYKLYRPSAKGSWKIYDVVTEDVSLVATYRDQFRKIIADKGFNGLLATLKAKKERLEAESAAGAGSN